MPGKNPPRKTTIRGERHLLAYITPAEADLLKAHGGAGKKVNGIPAFYGGSDPGRSQGGFGGRGRDYGGGGRDDIAKANRRTASGKDAVVEQTKRDRATKQLDQQIAKGKRNISQMTGLEKVLAAIAPGAGFNAAQNVAAQFMGGRMKNVLSEEGSRAVRDPKTGRVVGAYNSRGQLTGRDPEKDRQRAAAAERGGGGQGSPILFGAGLNEEEKPTLAKKVIRTDLAKEIEAERTQRRKAGVSQLSRRSLLSNVSRLGV